MGKYKLTFEVDEMAMKRIYKSRNPVAIAKMIHIECKYCGTQDVFRYGYDRNGKQRFVCNQCKRTFIDNKAPPRMRFPSEAIAMALNMFYESSSLSKIHGDPEAFPHSISSFANLVSIGHSPNGVSHAPVTIIAAPSNRIYPCFGPIKTKVSGKPSFASAP